MHDINEDAVEGAALAVCVSAFLMALNGDVPDQVADLAREALEDIAPGAADLKISRMATRAGATEALRFALHIAYDHFPGGPETGYTAQMLAILDGKEVL